MDRTLIDQFEAAPADIRTAIAGLGRDDLLAFPVPGTWSIQQIVVHLWDSDVAGTQRIKRVIAEDKPLLIGYDATKFSASLFYEEEPLEEILDLIERNRRQVARVLRRLPDEAFQRVGIHSERGMVTLAEFVNLYVWHVGHHLKFVRDKRALLGKPLSA